MTRGRYPEFLCRGAGHLWLTKEQRQCAHINYHTADDFDEHSMKPVCRGSLIPVNRALDRQYCIKRRCSALAPSDQVFCSSLACERSEQCCNHSISSLSSAIRSIWFVYSRYQDANWWDNGLNINYILIVTAHGTSIRLKLSLLAVLPARKMRKRSTFVD